MVSVHGKRNRKKKKAFYSTLHRAVNKNTDKIRAINHNNISAFQASFVTVYSYSGEEVSPSVRTACCLGVLVLCEFYNYRLVALSLALLPFNFNRK